MEGDVPYRREKVPLQGLNPRKEPALVRAMPRNGLWPVEDPYWSMDTPWATLKVKQKKQARRKERWKTRARSKEWQDGATTC